MMAGNECSGLEHEDHERNINFKKVSGETQSLGIGLGGSASLLLCPNAELIALEGI